MSQILVSGLTFGYDADRELIFEGVSFSLDTRWKLGLIGRNGKGKTTLLRLLLGELEHRGEILMPVKADYFPFALPDEELPALLAVREILAPYGRMEREMEKMLALGEAGAERYGEVLEQYLDRGGYTVEERLAREARLLQIDPEALGRKFSLLSRGERTKLMLAALFLKDNGFLLIDEPTDHLDSTGRETLARYLAASGKGYILVSHDRDFLDRCTDHVLSIGRNSIEVQRGNFSTWEENRERRENFEAAEDERLKKDIRRLKQAAAQRASWAEKAEQGKLGSRNSGLRPDRGYIGHKAAKMMKRASSIERRTEEAIREKEMLLREREHSEPLKLQMLLHPQRRLLELREVSVLYGGRPVFAPVSFCVEQGERIALEGANGSGKTSLFRLLLGEELEHAGQVSRAAGLEISCAEQDTSRLRGSLSDYIAGRGLPESLLKAVLRKMDFSREQFQRPLERYSEGQKKKLLLAASLCRPGHLLLWDEPLNYVDVLSRMQLEELLCEFSPTILFVEHDGAFRRRVAQRTVRLQKP